MTNQDTGAPAPNAAPQRDGRRGGRGTLWVVLALAAGLVAGGVLSTAFAQGYGWHPGFMGGGGWHHGFMGGGWHHAGFMGGPLNPAQIEERIDRMTKHMAIERLRAEQVGLAETASNRIAQALADASDALSPDQRRKIGDWVESFGPRWHRD